MDKVGVIVFGAGKSALRHGKAIKKSDKLTLSGFFDPALDKARALAAQLECTAFESEDAAIAAEGRRFALISTPPNVHRELALRLLERGVDVLVEKPFSTSPDDCDEVQRAADRLGRLVASVAQHRYSDGYRALRDDLERQEIGDIKFVTVEVQRERKANVFQKIPWRRDRAIAGGGVLLSIGFHYVDLACGALGPATEVETCGLAMDEGVEGLITVRCRLGGAPAIIDCRWGDVPDSKDTLTITGTRGTRTLRGGALLERGIPPTDGSELHLRQLEELAARVLDRGAPGVPPAAVKPALELVRSAYAALS